MAAAMLSDDDDDIDFVPADSSTFNAGGGDDGSDDFEACAMHCSTSSCWSAGEDAPIAIQETVVSGFAGEGPADSMPTLLPVRTAPIGSGALRSAFHELQGRRKTMEDAHLVLDALPPLAGGTWHALYALFDGHGGRETAEYCAAHLQGALMRSPHFASDPGAALTEAVAAMEAGCLALCSEEKTGDGTTLVAMYVRGTELWVANVGDSEAVLASGGGAEALTEIHNPAKNPAEIERVRADGGNVMADNRLSHPQLPSRMFSIAVSRSIGDYTFKGVEFTGGQPSGLTAVPHIRHVALTDAAAFVVIACDGVWDVMSHADAVGLVTRRMVAGLGRDEIAKTLAERALSLGSQDNITVILVFFEL
eukprot:c10168_g1_i1.p1 GENE.c10168_g1_i1~~c10168_g1_i1.p1  ORF type:complete len:364 (+),score=66.85 c10168_g1_i1:154-1245(+)